MKLDFPRTGRACVKSIPIIAFLGAAVLADMGDVQFKLLLQSLGILRALRVPWFKVGFSELEDSETTIMFLC